MESWCPSQTVEELFRRPMGFGPPATRRHVATSSRTGSGGCAIAAAVSCEAGESAALRRRAMPGPDFAETRRGRHRAAVSDAPSHRRRGRHNPQRFDQGYPPRTVPVPREGGVVMTVGRLRPSSDGGRVPRRRVPGALGPRATRRPQPRTPGPPVPARVRRPRRGSTAHRARPPEGWCPLCPCDAGTL